MKKPMKRQRVPDIISKAQQAMTEAVAEVYEQAAREGEALPIWDRQKGKVVWTKPKLKSAKNGRAVRARRNGKK